MVTRPWAQRTHLDILYNTRCAFIVLREERRGRCERRANPGGMRTGVGQGVIRQSRALRLALTGAFSTPSPSGHLSEGLKPDR